MQVSAIIRQQTPKHQTVPGQPCDLVQKPLCTTYTGMNDHFSLQLLQHLQQLAQHILAYKLWYAALKLTARALTC